MHTQTFVVHSKSEGPEGHIALSLRPAAAPNAAEPNLVPQFGGHVTLYLPASAALAFEPSTRVTLTLAVEAAQ